MRYQYEYEALTIQITITGKKYEKLIPNFDLWCKRSSPIKILLFEIGNIKSPAQGGIYTGEIQPGDNIELLWGMKDARKIAFRGKISWLFNQKTIKAIAKGCGEELFKIRTFINTRNERTSQIIKRIVAEAGINPTYISTDYDVNFDHWNSFGLTIQEALLQLKSSLQDSFGKDVSDLAWWIDDQNEFHFGTFADKKNGRNHCEKPLQISNKSNLIELEAPIEHDSLGRVKTHIWPWFDHSMKVAIRDDRLAKIDKEYRIEEVHHIQRERKARTELYIKEL